MLVPTLQAGWLAVPPCPQVKPTHPLIEFLWSATRLTLTPVCLLAGWHFRVSAAHLFASALPSPPSPLLCPLVYASVCQSSLSSTLHASVAAWPGSPGNMLPSARLLACALGPPLAGGRGAECIAWCRRLGSQQLFATCQRQCRNTYMPFFLPSSLPSFDPFSPCRCLPRFWVLSRQSTQAPPCAPSVLLPCHPPTRPPNHPLSAMSPLPAGVVPLCTCLKMLFPPCCWLKLSPSVPLLNDANQH